MEEQSERALITSVIEGSIGAFEELMKTYERLVYGRCFAYTGNREDALDVTQEVFIKVYEKIGSFRGSGSFRAWLLRIAHNESLNWIRRRSRHDGHDQLTAANSPEQCARQETDLLESESMDHITAALVHLNPRYRRALMLRYFDGMSVSEIASLLECTEGTAKNILFRGLKKLRDQLVPHWGES